MAIDNLTLLSFTNESIRNISDLLAGILSLPDEIINVVIGKNFATVLGTTNNKLLQAEPWTNQDYMDLGAPEEILNSDSGGRTILTNYDIIGILRVLIVLQQMINANPSLKPLVYKIAVNPRVK